MKALEGYFRLFLLMHSDPPSMEVEILTMLSEINCEKFIVYRFIGLH